MKNKQKDFVRTLQKWETAIFDLVDYFPYLNKYEANMVNEYVAEEE